MTHPRIATAALAGAALAFSLGAAEAVVRLFVPAPARENFTAVPHSIRIESPWPDVPYLLRPGAEVQQFFHIDPRGTLGPEATLTYHINSLGFRGPEETLEKPPGAFRILGLGDSFTFGTGVREEDTFLGVLRGRLRRRGPYQVWNLGIMGFDTGDEVALLYRVGLDYAPDGVVLTFFLNDAGAGSIHAALGSGLRDWELPVWRRAFRSADLLATALERRRAERELVADYLASFSESSPGWKRARLALARARDLSRSRGFRLALVVFPVLYRLSDGYPFATIHRTVTDFAEELGVPVLDLLPAFAGHDGPELWVRPTNQHPNETGHALAAGAIEGFLIENGWVRASVEASTGPGS